MADSSFEKGLTELAKMKVADLKAELKQRGLPTTGNKNELVERLHLSIHDTSLSLDETADEILDEDAVLDDEELETEELSADAKPDSLTTAVVAQKRKAPAEEDKAATKKIILNRNHKIEEVKVDNGTAKKEEEVKNGKPAEESDKKVIKLSNTSSERLAMRAKKFGMPLTEAAKREMRAARFTAAANKVTVNNNQSVIKTVKTTTVTKTDEDKDEKKDSEKKVIKLSELSSAERLEMRAKKFGVPLSDTAKKEARAARFNTDSNSSSKSASSIKSTPVPASYELLKKRAERFGTNVSTLLEKAELEAKKEQRKARFGEIKPLEKVSATKIKLVK